MLLGNNDNEAGLFNLISQAGGGNVSAESTAMLNLGFTCPAAKVATARSKAKQTTWRYRYFGNWPNNKLTDTSGAWHGSEIGLLFGTTAIVSGQQPTPDEAELGNKMRHVWATFAKDPAFGLWQPGIEWPNFDPERVTLVRLGYNNSPNIDFTDPADYDDAQPYTCSWWEANKAKSPFGGTAQASTSPSTTTDAAPGSPPLVNVAPALPVTSETVRPFVAPPNGATSFPYGIRPGVSGEGGKGKDSALPVIPRDAHSPADDGFDRRAFMGDWYDAHPHRAWQGYPRSAVFPDVLDGSELEKGGVE
jgi:hypothetical protein